MPLPTTQAADLRSQGVVRMIPNIADKKNFAHSLLDFLRREMDHWLADLKERQKEGEYYLGWLDVNDPAGADEGNALTFREIVEKEVPALIKRVQAQSAFLEESEVDQLLSIQQVYVQLCKRYDHIKLEILEKMEWGNNMEIY